MANCLSCKCQIKGKKEYLIKHNFNLLKNLKTSLFHKQQSSEHTKYGMWA